LISLKIIALTQASQLVNKSLNRRKTYLENNNLNKITPIIKSNEASNKDCNQKNLNVGDLEDNILNLSSNSLNLFKDVLNKRKDFQNTPQCNNIAEDAWNSIKDDTLDIPFNMNANIYNADAYNAPSSYFPN